MIDVDKFQQQGKMYGAFKMLYAFLAHKICGKLLSVASSFKGYINLMEESGIPEEECSLFKNVFFPDDEKKFEALIYNISTHDLKWLHSRVDDLRAQMRVSGDGMEPGPIIMNQPSYQISSVTPQQFLQRLKDYQSYEAQLDALCDFMNFLVEQRDYMNYIIKDYQDTCRTMISDGVPREVMDKYWQEFGYPNGLQIKGIINHIENDYDHVNKVYRQIYDSLINVNGNFVRSPKPM